MPDKNPDVGPTPPGHREPTREEILRHTAPAGLKRWGVIALMVLAVVAIAGFAWRKFQSHNTRSWTADQAGINLGYTRIVAPFDGIVTSRNIDIGNLVVPGTPTATPLFTVSDQKHMRIYVNVPQNYSAAIHPGMKISFTAPDYPGKSFDAGLVASAGAVASATNTMLVQFGADNSDSRLKPGGYADVKLPLSTGVNGVHLPATALIFRDSGMQVAVVNPDNKIAMKPVFIQRDMGAAVDVAAGSLQPSDRIVDNPPDSLQAGDTVVVAKK